MAFRIKRNDTSPNIEYYLKDSDGNKKDITGASVKFYMKEPNDDIVIDADAIIVDASEGRVKYSWSVSDTDKAGSYYAEWEVTFDSGKIETWPNEGFIVVKIDEDIE